MLLVEFTAPKNLPAGSFHSLLDDSNLDELIPNKLKLQLEKFIKNNCSEYLQICQLAGHLLYRGLTDTESKIFLGQPRTDRKSMGLNQSQHAKLIACFQLAGLAATRNSTISCSSDLEYVEDFGNTYAIFPLNGFKYTWSTKHSDIGSLGSELDNLDLINIKSISKPLAEKIIKQLGFIDSNLGAALIRSHEVAVAGRYLALEYELLEELDLGLTLN